jgi:hypothetical protein
MYGYVQEISLAQQMAQWRDGIQLKERDRHLEELFYRFGRLAVHRS